MDPRRITPAQGKVEGRDGDVVVSLNGMQPPSEAG